MYNLGPLQEQLFALARSPQVGNVPKQIPDILQMVHDALMDLQQRIAELERNVLDDPNVLKNPDVLKK